MREMARARKWRREEEEDIVEGTGRIKLEEERGGWKG